MIIMKSDYSPQAAAELQEEDNLLMVFAALHCTGLKASRVQSFREYNENAAELYNKALGSVIKEDNHSYAQRAAAVEAAKPDMDRAAQILIRDGITISNVLRKSDDDGLFSHIETTVYEGGIAMIPVARIERPILDIEAETYVDNDIGWKADHTEKHGGGQ